jgi:hypothetical protein
VTDQIGGGQDLAIEEEIDETIGDGAAWAAAVAAIEGGGEAAAVGTEEEGDVSMAAGRKGTNTGQRNFYLSPFHILPVPRLLLVPVYKYRYCVPVCIFDFSYTAVLQFQVSRKSKCCN